MPNDQERIAELERIRSACQPVLEAEQRLADALRAAKQAAIDYRDHAHGLTDAFGMERPAGPWDAGGENHGVAMECRTGIKHGHSPLDDLLAESRQRHLRIKGIAEQAALEAQDQ